MPATARQSITPVSPPQSDFGQKPNAPLAGLKFQVHEAKLLADFRMGVFQFLGDLENGLIQAQTALHANDEKIERIGQSAGDLMLALLRHAAHILIGAEEADAHGRQDRGDLVAGLG